TDRRLRHHVGAVPVRRTATHGARGQQAQIGRAMSLAAAHLPQDYAPASDALKDRVVLNTGASGGLGRASAIACAQAGAIVLLAGRKRRALEKVYDEIVALPHAPQPVIQLIDLLGATPADCEKLAHNIRDELGGLDGIV